MAILHTAGTKLEVEAPAAPLNRHFIFSLGFIFLVAMHFFTPNPGGSGLALSFNPVIWFGLSITLAIGLYQLATNHTFRYSRLTIGLLASCILLTVPEFYTSANIEESVTRLAGLWVGLLFFFLLQQFHFSNKQKQRILWFIILAVVIESLFGYFQYSFSATWQPFRLQHSSKPAIRHISTAKCDGQLFSNRARPFRLPSCSSAN